MFRKDFFAVAATEISLSMNDFPWAEFRSTKSGVKINMKYDINNSVPDYLFITNAKEHENNTLDKMRLKRATPLQLTRGTAITRGSDPSAARESFSLQGSRTTPGIRLLNRGGQNRSWYRMTGR